MELKINGHKIDAFPGQTLAELVAALGLDDTRLSKRPLAAKIAGEVFTLNYIPVRNEAEDGARRAMVQSGGCVNLLYYSDPAGKDVYERTANFVLFFAIDRLWPKARTKMTASLGPGVYIEVQDAPDFSAQRLVEEMHSIIAQDLPILRRRIPTRKALEYFQNRGSHDKAELLNWWPGETFDEYVCGDFHDHYFGEMAPSTGYVTVWNIRPEEGGFLFLMPDDMNPDQVGAYQHMPHFFSVFTEGERWCELMECETVADLNRFVESGRIRQLIRVNEALHEKRFAKVADMICQRGVKAVMLAGPSSSGKTTSANRLATQLRVYGKKPILMSLDDYYIDRSLLKPGPDGKFDFEHIDTIDTGLFREHIGALIRGEEVELPGFDFKSGCRVWSGHMLRMNPDSVIIVEGLHALNPVLRPEGVDESAIFKLYVSPLIPLDLDHHARIPTNYLRLLRRIVRDHETRGASVQRTLSMWDSVRQGEKRWIYPFQESADVIFNSSTLYELAVLKRHVFALLNEIGPEDPWYEEVGNILKILNYVVEADVEDEIPPTSLVREFIGGNSFYRK